MPKINEGMFRLEIRLDDHEPPHCHAVCSSGEVKIRLLESDVVLYPMTSKSSVLGNLTKSEMEKGTEGC